MIGFLIVVLLVMFCLYPKRRLVLNRCKMLLALFLLWLSE